MASHLVPQGGVTRKPPFSRRFSRAANSGQRRAISNACITVGTVFAFIAYSRTCGRVSSACASAHPPLRGYAKNAKTPVSATFALSAGTRKHAVTSTLAVLTVSPSRSRPDWAAQVDPRGVTCSTLRARASYPSAVSSIRRRAVPSGSFSAFSRIRRASRRYRCAAAFPSFAMDHPCSCVLAVFPRKVALAASPGEAAA